MAKLFSILTLMRPANIVTAVSDIIAGIAIAGAFSFADWDRQSVIQMLLLVISTIGLYGGGIVFNDIFDIEADRIHRPERILPRGRISIKEAVLLGCLLLLGGIGTAAMVSPLSGMVATIIAALALSYDKISKHFPVIGPLNMGLCRAGNLLLGMSINPDFMIRHWYIGCIPILFIAAITLTAKKESSGNNKSSIVMAMLLDIVVVAIFISMSVFNHLNILITLPFLLFWYSMNFFAKYKAFTQNQPALIQRAVKMGVLSLIPLNASYVAGFSGWLYALPVLALLPLSILLAKKFAVT
jgi:hypothetical protein